MNKKEKIGSIISSCITYDQVQTCFSFVTGPFFSELSDKMYILGLIQKKAYEIRNKDLRNHIEKMNRIANSTRKKIKSYNLK